jgi:hypothetical protein
MGREQVTRCGMCGIALDRQRQRPRQFLDRRQFQSTPPLLRPTAVDVVHDKTTPN